MNDLNGALAFITGGASGAGLGQAKVFGRAGAYGWDISHHEFLRHPPPAFVVL